MSLSEPFKPSKTIQANIDLLTSREQVGTKKYGVTLDDANLTVEQLLQHQLEELLDGANYTQAALMRLRNQEKPSPPPAAAEPINQFHERDLLMRLIKQAIASCTPHSRMSWKEQEAAYKVIRAVDRAMLDYTAGAVIRGVER